MHTHAHAHAHAYVRTRIQIPKLEADAHEGLLMLRASKQPTLYAKPTQSECVAGTPTR